MRVDKYTDPTRLDKMPYGSLWRVLQTNRQYVQINDDKNNPEWLKVEDVIARIAYVFKPSDRVIAKVLDMYKYNI